MPSLRPRKSSAGWPVMLLGLWFWIFLLAGSGGTANIWANSSVGLESTSNVEFSARLIWRTGKRSSEAQVFVKGDRYRIEHQGGIKTDLGYASVTIVRLDQQKVWYILSKQRLVVAVPLTTDYLLP